MRFFGLVLVIGGFLIRILTQSTSMDILAWVLMILGVVIVIISYLTKKK